MKPFRVFILVLGTLWVSLSVTAQAVEGEAKPCSQDAVEKQNMITEADAAEFNVRRVEIYGNTYSRYRVFKQTIAFGEGDIFATEDLLKSIDGMNGLDVIEPITIDNVEITLDRKNRDIDFVFCVTQKEKKKI